MQWQIFEENNSEDKKNYFLKNSAEDPDSDPLDP